MAFIPQFEENLVNTCMHCLFLGNVKGFYNYTKTEHFVTYIKSFLE